MIARLLIAASLATIITPISPASSQTGRHHVDRPAPRRVTEYDRMIRLDRLERRITERERLRDRQRDNARRQRERYEDLVDDEGE